MFINVKRLELFENLIKEAEIIKYDADLNDLLKRLLEEARRRAQGESGSELDMNAFMDAILFQLGYTRSEEFVENFINGGASKKTFGDPSVEKVINEYLEYLIKKFTEFRKLLSEALSRKEINVNEVKKLEETIKYYAVRLSILERIYASFSNDRLTIKQFAARILEKIKSMNSSLGKVFSMTVEEAAKRTKVAYQSFESADKSQKKEKAKEVFDELSAAKDLTEGYPEDFSNGINQAEKEYTNRISSEIGQEETDLIRKRIYVNKNIAALIRSIFEFQYTSWSKEADVTREAHALRTRVNGYPDVSDEAKTYLINLINEVEKSLLERLKKTEFDVSKFKGIHYDFNKRLPLYEKTALPVTGKQIADDTKIMKFRKASQYLMNLFFGPGSTPNTDQARGFEASAKWLNNIYSQTLNYTAMKIGKAWKGREGEMKADALSRLFITDTSLVDRKPKPPVTEDAVAPGVSVQTPGSIGAMGPIVPPTSTSLGSGDNFSPKKKKSKPILDFSSFIKEKNTFN